MPYRPALPDWLGRWLLTHRKLVLLAIAVVTAAAGYAFFQVPVRVSILRGLMSDESQYQDYLRRSKAFGGATDDLIFVATVEGEALFEPSTLDSIRAAAREIEQLVDIKRVLSFVDIPRFDSIQLDSVTGRLAKVVIRRELSQGKVPRFFNGSRKLPLIWPERANSSLPNSDPVNTQPFAIPTSAEVRESVEQNSLARRLVTDHQTAQIMLLWLDRDAGMDTRAQSGVRKQVSAILARHGLGKKNTHFVGTQVIQDWMFDEVLTTVKTILPITGLIVCLLVYLTFHRVSYVLLTLVIAIIAIIWSLGVSAVLFGQITLLVIAVPALILVISTADTIHLISAYVAELKSGMSRDHAIQKMFQDVGGACVLTSITTFIGFLSLLVVPAATLRHMAVAAAVGVASALTLALTLVPMALDVLKTPATETSTRWSVNRLFNWLLGLCQKVSLGMPRTVIVAHVIVMVACVYFASLLTIDSDLPHRFPGDHSISQAVRYFNKNSIGTGTVELYFQTDKDGFLSKEFLDSLTRFEARLAKHDEVLDVTSVDTALKDVAAFVDLDGHDPTTALGIVRLIEHLQPDAARSLVSQVDQTIRVTVRVKSTRVVHVYQLSEQFRNMASEMMPKSVQIETSGYYPIVGLAVEELVKNQIDGFLLCFACVMAVVTFGTRSIRLSILAIFPNILPLLLLGGTLGMFFDVVDSDVLGIAIVSFGLAVDDTIHFLHRYEIESAETDDNQTALARTYTYTGSAILKTTIILGTGLAPFAISGYLSIWLMGTYLVFVLTCAVFADLLLLPSSILVFCNKQSAEPIDADLGEATT